MLYTNKIPITMRVTAVNGKEYDLYVRAEHCFYYKGIVRAFDLVHQDGKPESFSLLPHSKTKEFLQEITKPMLEHPDISYWLATRTVPIWHRAMLFFLGAKKDFKELLDHMDDYFLDDCSYYEITSHQMVIREKLYIQLDHSDEKRVGSHLFF